MPQGRTFRRRRSDRPEEIRAAALEEFAAHGFAAARLDAIAARAGVSKGSIFRYYASKEALFCAATCLDIAPHVARLSRRLARSRGRRAVIRALIQGAPPLFARARLGPLLRIAIAEGPQASQLAHEMLEQVVAPLRAAVAAALGDSRQVPIDEAMTLLMTVLSPLVLAWLFNEVLTPAIPIELDALFSQHLDTLLDGARLPNPCDTAKSSST